MCVVSLSARSPEGSDAAYLAWHGLDHLPEQYGISSLVSGQRWVSTPSCRSARAAGAEELDAADHVVQYLFADPLEGALDRFFSLGAELREAGRMPLRLPPVELAAYELAERVASPRALVGAAVLPWRPCRGAYVLIEDGVDESREHLCDVDGVAGVWRYTGAALHDRLVDTTGRQLTVCYLDENPAMVGARITKALDGPVMFGAPLETVAPFDWERSLP
jgi:hypothetical protein